MGEMITFEKRHVLHNQKFKRVKVLANQMNETKQIKKQISILVKKKIKSENLFEKCEQ